MNKETKKYIKKYIKKISKEIEEAVDNEIFKQLSKPQNQICQTIINEKTGEICGHDWNFHDVLSNEACHEMDCPCKKFKKENKK